MTYYVGSRASGGAGGGGGGVPAELQNAEQFKAVLTAAQLAESGGLGAIKAACAFGILGASAGDTLTLKNDSEEITFTFVDGPENEILATDIDANSGWLAFHVANRINANAANTAFAACTVKTIWRMTDGDENTSQRTDPIVAIVETSPGTNPRVFGTFGDAEQFQVFNFKSPQNYRHLQSTIGLDSDPGQICGEHKAANTVTGGEIRQVLAGNQIWQYQTTEEGFDQWTALDGALGTLIVPGQEKGAVLVREQLSDGGTIRPAQLFRFDSIEIGDEFTAADQSGEIATWTFVEDREAEATVFDVSYEEGDPREAMRRLAFRINLSPQFGLVARLIEDGDDPHGLTPFFSDYCMVIVGGNVQNDFYAIVRYYMPTVGGDRGDYLTIPFQQGKSGTRQFLLYAPTEDHDRIIPASDPCDGFMGTAGFARGVNVVPVQPDAWVVMETGDTWAMNPPQIATVPWVQKTGVPEHTHEGQFSAPIFSEYQFKEDAGAIAAAGCYFLTGQPTAGDKITLARGTFSRTYEWVADQLAETSDEKVSIESDAETAMARFAARATSDPGNTVFVVAYKATEHAHHFGGGGCVIVDLSETPVPSDSRVFQDPANADPLIHRTIRWQNGDVSSFWTPLYAMTNEAADSYETHRQRAAAHLGAADSVNVIATPPATTPVTCYARLNEVKSVLNLHAAIVGGSARASAIMNDFKAKWNLHEADLTFHNGASGNQLSTTPPQVGDPAVTYVTRAAQFTAEVYAKCNAHIHDASAHNQADANSFADWRVTSPFGLDIYKIVPFTQDLYAIFEAHRVKTPEHNAGGDTVNTLSGGNLGAAEKHLAASQSNIVTASDANTIASATTLVNQIKTVLSNHGAASSNISSNPLYTGEGHYSGSADSVALGPLTLVIPDAEIYDYSRTESEPAPTVDPGYGRFGYNQTSAEVYETRRVLDRDQFLQYDPDSDDWKPLIPQPTHTPQEIDDHIDATDNPHGVTATQVGLGNVLDVAQIPAAEKGEPLGVAELDAAGVVPADQLALSNVIYKGTWNANTNSPALSSSGGGGSQGEYYVVSVDGTTLIDGVSDWIAGDWIIHNGSVWQKSDHTDAVSSVAGRIGAVTLTGSDIGLEKIGTPAYSTLADLENVVHSAGLLTGGVVTDAGSETVNVALAEILIRTTDSQTGVLKFARVPAAAGVAIPTNTTRYIVAQYNAGTPQFAAQASESTNNNTEFVIAVVVNEAGTLHISQYEHAIGNHVAKLIERLHGTAHIEYDSESGGLIFSNTGTRNYAMTAGALWTKLNRYGIDAKNTSGADRFDAYYETSPGVFAKQSAQAQWNNTEYNTGGALATMTNGRWANHWLYLELDGGLVSVYGRAQFTSESLAQAESPPSTVPARISGHGILVAQVTFQKSAATATIRTAFGVPFSAAATPTHNALGGLQGGTTDEYYHLTSAQHGALTPITGLQTFTNPSSVAIGDANAAGSGTSAARGDHVHGVSAGTPVAVGSANAAGSATSFSRSDHVHNGQTNQARFVTCKKATSGSIAALLCVKAVGYDGTDVLVEVADAFTDPPVSPVFGVTVETVSDSTAGKVQVDGILTGSNWTTGNGYGPGAVLFCNQNGAISNEASVQGNLSAETLPIGIVLDSANPGHALICPSLFGIRGQFSLGFGKVNYFGSTIAPTSTWDSGDGFSAGSIVGTTAGKYYRCNSASVGAAVWYEIGAAPPSSGPQQVFIPAETAADGNWYSRVRSVGATGSFKFNVFAPSGFTVTKVELIGSPSAAGNNTGDIAIVSNWGSPTAGELLNANTGSTTLSNVDMTTTNKLFALDVSAAFSGFTGGDVGGFQITHGGGGVGASIDYLGVIVTLA